MGIILRTRAATLSLGLKEGEISGPVKSSSGFHIIKADKRTEKTLENNREDVKNAYLAQHAKPYDEVLNNLIKNGDVKVQDKQFTDLFKVQEEPKQDKDKEDDAKADTGDKKEDKASGEKKE
ncbi:peptidylprolyl isomerase [Siminovitchia fortis]|uniref:peptidylprolyl isomerase n=1 Tax=Siminovitchia fortis TaxID=254758 RepID=UPI0036F1A750